MTLLQPRRFHPLKTLLVASAIVALAIFAARRDRPGADAPGWSGATMGTTYSIRLARSPLSVRQLAALREAVAAELDRVNREMSPYRPDSEISRFNRSASTDPIPVPPSFARVCRFALTVSAASDGAFDPTLGPLIDLWGFGPEGRVTDEPTATQIDSARALTGYRRLRVLEDDRLQKDIPALRLDLGAVAKGYGVDAIAQIVRDAGVSDFFVEIGGEVYAEGTSPRGDPWRIGIDSPRFDALPGDELRAVLHLSNQAVATSGDYRNYREDERGSRLSHIIDPATGRPVAHRLASVTVTAPDCMSADALATAAFVLGPERGRELIEAWPDAEALFIVRAPDGAFEEISTPGFRAESPSRDASTIH